MHFFSFFLVIVLSSALFSLGIPNEWLHFGHPAGFLALVPVYYALLRCSSYKKAAVLFGVQILCVHLFSSFWLAFFGDFAVFTLGASSIAYFFLAMPFGMFFYYVLKKGKNARIFGFAAVWLMWEYFKSNGFVAYPWGVVAMTCFYLKRFIQIADVAGVWGLSFVLPLFAASLGEVLHIFVQAENRSAFLQKAGRRRLPFAAAVVLFAAINVYGIVVLHNKAEPETYLNTVIVQQNGDPWDMGRFESYLKNSQFLSRKAVFSAAEKPDLVVWSESALAAAYTEDSSFYADFPESEPFLDFLTRIKTPLLTGTAYYDENDKSYNSAFLILPTGRVAARSAKMQLIAFAEYMPFSDNPLVQKFFDKLVGFSSGWTPGTEYKVFSVENSEGRKVPFTVPICFEDAFPSLCRSLHNGGSGVLINITNDSWSKTASAEYQHFVISYFRAMELRTGFVRSTNSGFSCVVDAYGTVLDSLPLFTAGSMTVRVPVYRNVKTAYALLGDWLVMLVFVMLIKVLAADWLYEVRRSASRIVPNCHWKEAGPKFLKHIRRYKPLFAVRRSCAVKKSRCKKPMGKGSSENRSSPACVLDGCGLKKAPF